MAKYKHMTLDERIGIQKGLKEKKSFIEIGTEIDRDASTVAKEIKSHLLVKETGTRSRPYNPCKLHIPSHEHHLHGAIAPA